MTTPLPTSNNNSQIHNDIMATGSRDRPLMLATGGYAQWQSRFMRYINTRPSSKELKQCIYDDPYVMIEILVLEKPATSIEEAVPTHTITETYKNTTPEKCAYFNVEAEVIHLILTGIGDDIYSIVDACTTGDWLDDTDEEPDEQELEAHYILMAKIQEFPSAESGPTFDVEPMEKVHIDKEYNVFTNDQEHTDQPENMNDTPLMEMVDRNTSPDSSDVCNNDFEYGQNADDQEDERCKYALAESNDIRDRCKSAIHNQEIELEKYKKYKDCQIEKEELERKLKASLDRLAQHKLQTVEALTFANPKYLKKAQSEKPCLYKVPFDKDDLANIFAPDCSSYTKSLDELYVANEIRKKMWRKSFVKYKPNIVKNISFLPTQASLSKSRHPFNIVQHNITDFKEIVDLDREKRMDNRWQQPITQKITVLVKNLLITLVKKTKENAYAFEYALKKEMFEDLKYVQSLEKEVDELQSDKNKFSNEYDLLLQECLTNNIMCATLSSMTDIDEYSEIACKYLEKIKECERLEIELSKQTENVSKEVYIELLRSFAKLEKHSISLELTLQQCQ
ncbi:hypothetical protein Tco_0397262 [Tanacetum coccineum]